MLLMQRLAKQSVSTTHPLPSLHLGQLPPPQSTSVSASSIMSFVHVTNVGVGVGTMVGTGVGTDVGTDVGTGVGTGVGSGVGNGVVGACVVVGAGVGQPSSSSKPP